MKRFVLCLCLLAVGCAPRDDTPPDIVPDKPGKQVEIAPTPKVPDALQPRIDAALAHVRSRDLRTTHAFWTIFHGILGLGPEITLLDEKTGERVNALDRICAGDRIR